MKTMELIVNGRPDRKGILWFSVRDSSTQDAAEWGGRLANYFEANRTFVHDAIVTECHQVFVGIDTTKDDSDGQPLTTIIRRISEFFTGNPFKAQFRNATHETINAGDADADLVSPVLYFLINCER